MKGLTSLLLLIFTALFLPTVVLASSTRPTAVMQNMQGTAGMTHTNDYQLAYPGMLPDNPFYKLKVLRDKIWEVLVTDPQKKVDFYLLQTDKQIGMVPPLVTKGEITLAKSTALKAENNFTKLVFVYKDNGLTPDATTYKKLLQAADKHQQILIDAMKQVSANDAQTFQQVINFSKTNVNSLTQLFTKSSH